MNNNNNNSVLPFYDSRSKQNHNKPYSYGDVYPLYAPYGRILQFQINVPSALGAAAIFRLFEFETNRLVWQLPQDAMTSTGFEIVLLGNFAQGDYSGAIVYASTAALSLPHYLYQVGQGRYYLVVNYAYNAYVGAPRTTIELYSEVFTWVNPTSNFLKLEWYDVNNLRTDSGVIVYKTTKNIVRRTIYIATELGKPDYVFNEEGEDRDGYFFPTVQLAEKVYRFVFVAPEFLCDVMQLIRLSDVVNVYDPYGVAYKCTSFLMTPKWLVQGNLASVECEFKTNTIVKKIPTLLTDMGDFNDDFNDDYSN